METTITISQEVANALKVLAQAKGVSESAFVERLIKTEISSIRTLYHLVGRGLTNVKFRFRDTDDDRVYTYLRWEWQTYTAKSCDAIGGKESMQTSRRQVAIYSDENGKEYVSADALNYVKIEVLC